MPSSSVKDPKADAPVKRRPRNRDDDPIPVVSGRFVLAAIFIGAAAMIPFTPLSRMLEPKERAHKVAEWKPGNVREVRITLVTSDYNSLDCAADTVLEGAHCAYKADKQPWPRAESEPLDDNKRNIFQPYRTHPDNHLVFLAGLWADPVMAWRLHREPPDQKPGKRFVRFVTECKVQFLGELTGAKYRWASNQTFDAQGNGVAGRVVSCNLKEL